MTTVVCDTSALMSCALAESGSEAVADCIVRAERLVISAVTRVELGIVAMARNITQHIDDLLFDFEVQVVPFDEELAHLAIAAFAQYGKGRHPAALNFGDCCSYALAKSLDLPLLYQGHDFARTDIASALA